MQVTIWGCRGSVPTPGPETVRYGGNTSCVEVALGDGTVLVLDAGTGLRALGLELQRRGARHINLLLTHLHLDHLEGLRFFAPLWDAGVTLDLWGPPSPTLSLRERVGRCFSPPLFPLDLRHVPASVRFHDVPRRSWEVADAVVRADLVLHPGPTVGFRIATGDGVLAYLPDHEPILAGPFGARTRDWISGAAIAADADLLLHDAQYSEGEYAERVGWGHSSVRDAVGYAAAVGARRLVLFHHEPLHSDDTLEELEAEARSHAGALPAQPWLARERMTLEVG